MSIRNNKKIIGIIGGMGPISSIKFYADIIEYCQVEQGAYENSNYPYLRITNLPVPDLINNTNQMAVTKQMIIDELIELEKTGISYFAIICNTVHMFIEEFRDAVNVPVLSIVEEAVKELKKKDSKKVLLLATPTTLTSKIFQTALETVNIKAIVPNAGEIEFLGKIILKLVANKQTIEDKVMLGDLIRRHIVHHDIDSILLGCTELSFGIDSDDYNIPIYNAVNILVKEIVLLS